MLDPSQLMGGAAGGGQKAPKPPSAGDSGAAGKQGGGGPAEGVQAAQKAAEKPVGSGLSGGLSGGDRAESAAKSGYEALPEDLRSIPEDKDEGDPQSIGHEDFLELMMVQLQNQDPTDPQDTEQMMGQIAQFTTASGIEQLQSDFREFFEHMRSDQSLRASQLVGREVVTESRQAYLPEDGEMEALLQLERSAPNLTVEIENAAGERVHREQLGEMEEGEHPFAWDGTNNDGQRLPQGTYQVNAYVEDGDEREPVPTLVGAPVTSVSVGMDGRPPELSVAGLGEMSLSDVKRIR
ncbi:flagellar hook assembly protein FlgD [Halorhodospira halophila]|uniref:Basal-body rod modification protein FlgD n=1 Tax=Halorhodospira halophila (strain DSM 244 / SL1) TaxID=349124 RepID=A1WUE3_HALHL|nr:flagellar hook assembly protein FlgD [Halorhodospira halophila]ABM61305.1 flagellar hook capping protein [Halorhodospira halophila SL1]MBK1729113.1 hypothetical protein [Halorhodospira halophila]